MIVERERRPELMDHPDVDAAQLARSLRDLRAVNRWLGGRRSAVRRLLEAGEASGRRPVRVLDVGTGGADLPMALVDAARARGLSVEVDAADVHPETLRLAATATARYPEIRIHAADARRLPWRDGVFDIAACCTMLHHFSQEDAVRILRELARVSRGAVIVTDLARSRPALWGAELLARSVWRRHPVTRHDGPVSVRGAFTPGELAGLAREAGLRQVVVRREPLFRLALEAAGASASSMSLPHDPVGPR